jgi:hypothetical protein
MEGGFESREGIKGEIEALTGEEWEATRSEDV